MAMTIVPFYNVTAAVGRGVGGYSTDIMLVQYMLFKICINPRPHFDRNLGLFGPVLSGPNGGRCLFPFTGAYSTDLDEWIMAFQRAANERGYGQLVVDGKINRAPVGWGQHSGGGHRSWYTIQAMNLIMYRTIVPPYVDFPNLSDMPAALGTELSRVALPEWTLP